MDTGKLLVVDGQQRLLSMRHFYDEVWKPDHKPFHLKGVQPDFEGRTYTSLRDEDLLGHAKLRIIAIEQIAERSRPGVARLRLFRHD